MTEGINSWLGLGPIYNPAHQSKRYRPLDEHPKAADIIFDIDDNPLDPRAITRSAASAPRAGGTQPYGNGKYFERQNYVWRILTFANVDWARNADVEDDIHRSLRAKGETPSAADPLSFAGKHHALVFLLVTITSPDDRKTSLHVRSDDALRIWLNGEEIAGLRWAGERDINAFSVEARAEIRLNQGGNVLLAAVAETHGEWGFSARIEDSAGLVMMPSEPAGTPPEEPSEPVPSGAFRVLGVVRHADGTPAPDLRVRAFDRDLRSEQLLGEARTDAKGHYQITYTAEQFARAEKAAADLVLRAVDSAGTEVATSGILFNAPSEATVNPVIGNAIYRGPSEFKQLASELAPLVGDIPFADLTEDDKNQDITFLCGETGRNAELISLFIQAHRLERETSLPAEVFYGLVRKGMPTDLPGLLSQSPDVLKATLVSAAADNIISSQISNDAEAIINQFKGIIVSEAMKPRPEASGTSLNDLLKLELPEDSEREAFLSAYVDHTGRIEDFWQRLREDPRFMERVEDIQRTLQLGALTGNHPPLIRELQQEAGQHPDYSHLAEHDEQGWFEIINKEVGGARIGVPPDVPGENEDEKACNYARTLSRRIEAGYPSAFVAHRLDKDDIPGAKTLSTFLKTNPDFDIRSSRLGSYLQAHPEALPDIQDQSRFRALQRVYRIAPRYEQTSPLLKANIRSAYALTQMGENAFIRDCGDAVGGKGEAKQIYANAQRIADTAKYLVMEHGPIRGRVSGHAWQDDGVTELEGVSDWKSMFGSLNLCACEHCRSVYGPAAYLVDVLHFLSYRKIIEVSRDELTGEIIGVTYVQKPDGSCKTFQDALFDRRPDIGEVELSCENTNTPVPYVDLVLEALENSVARFPEFSPFVFDLTDAEVQEHVEQLNKRTISDKLREAFSPPLSEDAVVSVGREGKAWDESPPWWKIDEPGFTYEIRKENGQLSVVSRSRQTKGTPEELAANPQYVNTRAYDVLKQAVYPWSLPFDLCLQETRSYLNHLQVPRWKMIHFLYPGDRLGIFEDKAISYEYLGISKSEADIITGTVSSQPGAGQQEPWQEWDPGIWNLWGFKKERNWKNTLSCLTIFLQRSGLSYREMLDLLDTDYINPHRAITIVSTDQSDTCDTDKLRLSKYDEGAFDDGVAGHIEVAGRMMRFVRLWRALGWSTHDLDRAYTAFGVPDNVEQYKSFLVRLSHVQRLHDALAVPVLALLSWWADIDTASYVDHTAEGQPRALSLYEQLFQNRATAYPPDPAFNNPAALKETKETLREHKATIAAALRIGSVEFEALIGNARIIPTDPTEPKLTPDNLSRLHRHVSLARALRLSITDYLSTLWHFSGAMSATYPFSTTTETLLFVEDVKRIRESGFTVAELDYLLRHSIRPEEPVAPADEAISILFTELRTGLQKIAEENTFRDSADDPAGPTVDLSGDLTRQKLALLNWDKAIIDDVIATLNDSIICEAPLKTLPATSVDLVALPKSFECPNELAEVISHSGGKLIASRLLTRPERNLLRVAASKTNNDTFISAVDTLFKVQDKLLGAVSYDSDREVLRCVGPMSKDCKDDLDAISEQTDYRAAVAALFDAPRHPLARAMRSFAVQDYSVEFVVSQDELVLPSALKRKIFLSPAKASGHIEFSGQPAENSTITLNGTKWTFVAGAPSGNQTKIAADLDVTLIALAWNLNTSTDAEVTKCTYTADTSSKRLIIEFDAAGPQGSSFALAASGDSQGTVSGSNLVETKRLHCIGPMRDAERENLLKGQSNEEYKKAINALYDEAEITFFSETDQFLTADDIHSLLDDKNKSPGDRFCFVIRKLLPHLRDNLKEKFIVERLAAALQLEARAADYLLRNLASPNNAHTKCLQELLDLGDSNANIEITAKAFDVQFKTFHRLHKAATVAQRLKLNPQQLKWLDDYGRDAGWLDLNALPVGNSQSFPALSDMLGLTDLARLRDRLPHGEQVIGELLAIVHDAKTGHRATNAAKMEWLSILAHQTHWPAADLEALLGEAGDCNKTGQLALVFPADFVSERPLARLGEVFGLIKRLGLSARVIADLATPDIPESASRALRQAVRGKYDQVQWLNIAKPLRDVLRDRQRAALVDFLLASRKMEDANELYAWLLMDVEMSPCMMTSRIKQAMGSAQLFVQRCLMNLEQGLLASAEYDPKWPEWQWMKSYRVWEANRKIFLYPENWIQPELRDDKSPFFRELESELLQSDLNQQAAEEAFRHYLEKLDQVARLEVVGVCHQLEKDAGGATAVDILHVFARTFAEPHIYFYRQRVDSTDWTAWERLDVGIEGDHLIPVVWHRRLYLFWPIFQEKTRPLTVSIKPAGTTTNTARPYWDVSLAWSERRFNKWGPKNTTMKSISVDIGQYYEISTSATEEKIDRSNICFRCKINLEDNSLSIIMMRGCTPSDSKCDLGLHFDDYIPYTASGSFQLNEPFTKQHVTDTPPVSRRVPNTTFYFTSPGSDAQTCYNPPVLGYLPFRTRPAFMSLHEIAQQSEESDDALCLPNFISIMPGSGVPDILYAYGEVDRPLLKSTPGVFKIASAADYSTVLKCPFFYMDEPDVSGNGLKAGRVFFVTSWPDIEVDTWSLLSSRLLYYYSFETFYHAYVSAFLSELSRNGVDGLLQRQTQLYPHAFALKALTGQPVSSLDFEHDYKPVEWLVSRYPFEDVDFGPSAAYALYNWEFFFHAPLLIADRLSKNQRYEEAHRWFHYIFNPTDASSLEGTKRYWQTRPFYEKETEDYAREQIESILELFAKAATPEGRAALSEQENLARVERSIDQWRTNPFKPHIIARLRTTAYQKTVVMKYLDNLIAWADQLFRRDTIESINEATQLYILAAEILGERPKDIPPRARPRVQTYNSLKPDLDEFSNAWVVAEELVALSPTNGVATQRSQASPSSVGMLYFCVPSNDKLLGYWDTVADRLFKMRHCMNIEGIVRQLPLFEPPIEPGLLVRAAAAGVDLTSVLNDLSGALPHYRFNVLVQKASELCSELKSLGQAMLSALEKRDAEQLSLLRAQHETALLMLVEQTKKLQYEEARQNKAALGKSRDTAATRYIHYQKLLGVESPQAPDIGNPIPEGSPSPHIAIKEEGGVKAISHEIQELDKLSDANHAQVAATQAEDIAAFISLIPNTKAAPWGVGVEFGGLFLANQASAVARAFRAQSASDSYRASRAGKLGQLALRAHDWLLQSNQAAREIMQIDQQILAAELRQQIADKELFNHRRQLANAREVEELLKSKYTNQELYGWMIGQLATVYFQTYQLAYDLAKRAERAFRHELAIKDSNYIQFGYWDSLKKGLLAGERLFHDIKRMELAYLDQHQREYEITKHVSLAQLDPLALIQLREAGSCQISMPEALFDLDFAGHYLRRIKTMSLSIPCVTGPYTGVNCTLTLLKSSVRHGNTLLSDKFLRQEGDPRFTDNIGVIESIVTSSGQNDSGLFEANLRDERYLPFEGAGVISEWLIELPAPVRQFDYDTISDVILHLRYTAREGGGQLRQQAVKELDAAINHFIRSEGQQGLARLFSLRHEFPTAWHNFLSGAAGHQEMKIDLSKERFPLLFSNRIDRITELDMFIKVKDGFLETYTENTLILELASDQTPPAPADALSLAPWNGLLRGSRQGGQLGTWTLYAQRPPESGQPLPLPQLDPKALEDILLVCLYEVRI